MKDGFLMVRTKVDGIFQEGTEVANVRHPPVTPAVIRSH